ncbi:porin [Paraburkholderia caledonica]|uniref:porin n=1 Tax=Paraburkholderia caledonica TaxID=134536 RepID=UPI0003A7F694|nr:porin [Paraburkholderia caledonica]
MKTKICKVTVGCTIACSGVHAHAQSSVTLYGLVDAGFTFTNNQRGEKAYQATASNYAGSRWGIQGAEDIGGGRKVLFKLENGFNPENGALAQGGRLFGRSAWVGISDPSYGSVTFGRQYNSVQDFLPYLQANGVGTLSGYGNAIYDTDAINNTYRSQNSVKYTSPTIGGLTGSALYGFSNAAGGFASNRTWSVGADYVNGPLRLDAAYALLDNPGSSLGGAIGSDNYFSLASSIISNVKRNRVAGGGAAYTFGTATLGLLYTNSTFDLQTGGSLHFGNYEVNLKYMLTPAVQLGLGYMYTTQRSTSATATNAHYHQIGAGTNYFLSKRTDVYLNAFYQRASGANAWIEQDAAPSSNNHQIVGVAGIRHRF